MECVYHTYSVFFVVQKFYNFKLNLFVQYVRVILIK